MSNLINRWVPCLHMHHFYGIAIVAPERLALLPSFVLFVNAFRLVQNDEPNPSHLGGDLASARFVCNILLPEILQRRKIPNSQFFRAETYVLKTTTFWDVYGEILGSYSNFREAAFVQQNMVRCEHIL